MSIWVTIIMTALGWLIQWLLSKKAANETLTDAEKRRLNGLLHKIKELRTLAAQMGCNADGELTEGAEPEKIDKRELDAAIKELKKVLK